MARPTSPRPSTRATRAPRGAAWPRLADDDDAVAGGSADGRHLAATRRSGSHRLSRPRSWPRRGVQSRLAQWLCADQRDAAGAPAHRGERAAVRRCGRRHHPAKRDHHRAWPGRGRAQSRRLFALTRQSPRPFAGPPRPDPPHLEGQRHGGRAGRRDPIRGGRGGRAPDPRGDRGAALYRPVRDSDIRPGSARFVGQADALGPHPLGDCGRCHRDPVLPRHRIRLAGQLCRDIVGRRRPARPVCLADAGQWRRNQLRRRPDQRGGRNPQPRRRCGRPGSVASDSPALLAGRDNQHKPWPAPADNDDDGVA